MIMLCTYIHSMCIGISKDSMLYKYIHIYTHTGHIGYFSHCYDQILENIFWSKSYDVQSITMGK